MTKILLMFFIAFVLLIPQTADARLMACSPEELGHRMADYDRMNGHGKYVITPVMYEEHNKEYFTLVMPDDALGPVVCMGTDKDGYIDYVLIIGSASSWQATRSFYYCATMVMRSAGMTYEEIETMMNHTSLEFNGASESLEYTMMAKSIHKNITMEVAMNDRDIVMKLSSEQ